MQTLGGKHHLATEISAIIASARKAEDDFWDLCCGTGNVCAAVTGGRRFAVDVVPSLVSCLRETAAGRWKPPNELSKETYDDLHARWKLDRAIDDPLVAFAALGCSFGGKWFGGYARRKPGARKLPLTLAAGSAKGLLKKAKNLFDVTFICDLWQNWIDRISGVAYIDPEYANTTKYSAAPRHDPVSFWRSADALSERCRVFVSEYAGPPHWREVAAWPKYKRIARGQCVERLFTRDR